MIDLKSAPIYKLFFAYFLPALIAMLALSTYTTFDGIFIGKKLGENALAAVGVAWPIFPVLIAYELLFGIGAAAMSSYFLGRKKEHRARIVFSTVFYFALISSVFIGFGLYFYSYEIAVFLGASEILVPLVVEYIEVIFLGSFVIVLHPLLDIFALNDRRPLLAMTAMIIGALSNIFLNYIFIFILDYGLFGAALATILGHLIGALILLQHFIRRKGQLFLIKAFDFFALLMSAKNGIPQSSSEISVSIMMLTFNHFIENLSGERGLAIYGTLMYIGIVPYTILLSMAQGIQPIASFNFGAKQINRVKEIFFFGLGVSLVGGILLYILFYFCGEYVLSWFVKNDFKSSSFIIDAKEAMNIYFLGYAFIGISIVGATLFQAIQRTLSSLIIAFSYELVFIGIYVLILPHYYGFLGVLASFPLGVITAAFVTLFVTLFEFKKGSLKKGIN